MATKELAVYVRAAENMAKKARKLVLPFAVPAQDREDTFTEEMEKAAVFYLAEMERKKGGGILNRRNAEELLFAAKFCYPIWQIPWGERSLLFDGLGTKLHKLHYNTLPDIKAFTSDVQVSAKTREAYSAFLSDRLNFFKDFTGKEEKVIDGLITDPKLTQDLSAHLKDAHAVRDPMVDRALMSPALDESRISSIAQDLSNHKATLENEIESLSEAMKLLNTTTERQVKAIRERTKETREEFAEKTANLKSSLTKKRSRIRERYDRKITSRTKEIEGKLHRLHQKRVKLEKTIRNTTAKIKRCEAEIRSCRLSKDSNGELRWKEEIETCRKRISVLEKKIKDLDEEIEEATAAKKQEILILRSECDEKVENAMRIVRDTEAARDAKIRMSKQEIESLEDFTKTIVDQINSLVEAKREALDKFEEMGIQKRIRKYALLHVSFYLVCYQEKLKNRYVLYPPSVAGSMSKITRLKGVLGAAKAKSILGSRSETIKTLLDDLIPLIEQNPVFGKEMMDAGIEANILRTKNSREKIEKGLEELQEEGWLSESELQTFSEFSAEI